MLSNEKDYLLNPPLSLLGPEPWDLDVNTFHKGLQRRKSEPIKEALLDQTLISGLGNIYDDEVLFATKINPKMEANLISLKQAEAIKKESIRILREAIKNGGSTIRSYHPKEGVSGMMQNELLAYGKGNTPCSRCGFPLRKISIGGRGTVYCPICQHIEGKPLIVGVTGPIASGKSSVSTYLESNGYQKIDADAIVSSLYMESDVKNGLSSLFGEEAIKDGNVDRDYLSKVLLDGANKEKLDSFIHPLVYKRIEEEINNSKAKRIVIDVPLLIDSPLEEICDLIIYVEANEKTQIARLVERGKDPKTSLAINSGFPRGKAKKKAGIVIDANYDINHLKKELESYDFLLDK
jgi:formamidopyrimidine-DNA glycosylase